MRTEVKHRRRPVKDRRVQTSGATFPSNSYANFALKKHKSGLFLSPGVISSNADVTGKQEVEAAGM